MLENNEEEHLTELVRLMLGQVQGGQSYKAAVEPEPVKNRIAQCSLKGIKHKAAVLNLAEELGNVSEACRIMGISRNTFYRYKVSVTRDNRYQGLLKNESQRQPNLGNRIDSATAQAVLAYSRAYPRHRQSRVSNELLKNGIVVSPRDVFGIWLRYDLTAIEDRMIALGANNASHGSIPTLMQVIASSENISQDDGLREGADTAYPGYLGVQDTLFAGVFKGIGLVYQQTFVDAYSQVAFAKLYTAKTSVTAVDLLSHKVLPFFFEHNLPLQTVLTGRGSEYCGRSETHSYRQYLRIKKIEHKKVKANSSQFNSSFEAFYRTFLVGFKSAIVTKKVYDDLGMLQKELDEWLDYYNHEKPNNQIICRGRTPMETLREFTG